MSGCDKLAAQADKVTPLAPDGARNSPGPVSPLVCSEGDPVGGAVCPPELVAAGHRVASARAHAPGLGPRHPVTRGVARRKYILDRWMARYNTFKYLKLYDPSFELFLSLPWISFKNEGGATRKFTKYQLK